MPNEEKRPPEVPRLPEKIKSLPNIGDSQTAGASSGPRPSPTPAPDTAPDRPGPVNKGINLTGTEPKKMPVPPKPRNSPGSNRRK